jgi:hypothetical protein
MLAAVAPGFERPNCSAVVVQEFGFPKRSVVAPGFERPNRSAVVLREPGFPIPVAVERGSERPNRRVAVEQSFVLPKDLPVVAAHPNYRVVVMVLA